MNTQEKETQQKYIVMNLKNIETAIAEAVKVKDTFRAKMQDLNMHGTATYSQEYLEKEVTRLKADHLGAMQAAHKKVSEQLEALRKLIHDRDTVLDLANPALGSALLLILTTGGNLSYDDAQKINANFMHDQSALRTIRAAYKSDLGGIDKLIYDAGAKIDYLQKLAYQGLVQDGSINYFSTELAKLATLEGTTVEKLPDLQGAEIAIRKAAGLS